MKIKKHKVLQANISEKFGKYSHDYFSQGSNIDEVKNYLNVASIAWNLSLYPEQKRIEEIENIANDYERLNPEHIKSEHLKRDLEILVEKKLKLFPKIERLITKISIEEKGDNYLIHTDSKEFQP